MLLVAAWLTARAPVLRHDIAAAAASPWLARAEAALAADQVEVARQALILGLARDPASSAATALLRRLARTVAHVKRVLAFSPRLDMKLSEIAATDMLVICRATAPPWLRMLPPAASLQVFAPADPSSTPAAPSPPRASQPRETDAAGDRATEGYRLLEQGDRRGVARALAEAGRIAPLDARGGAWARQLDFLTERWSGDAYIYARSSGAAEAAATAAPVLGGGQSGAQLSYSLDPLAKRPLAILGRASVANSDRDSAQASLGLNWRPDPHISIAAERLFGIGVAARSAWNLRLAGGTASRAGSRLDWSIYGEGGVIGARRRDVYAAALAHAGIARPLSRRLTLGAAVGGWTSVQHTDRSVSRFETGPTLRLQATTPLPLYLSLDYRVRIAGNAAPGSGPALTLSTAF